MKIIEVEILTNNLEETEKFYSKVLEIQPKYKDSEKIEFIIGKSKLVFIQSDVDKPVYHFAINILASQLDNAVKWIKNKTELLAISGRDDCIAEFENWNSKSVYFYDNNGNLCELIARFDLTEEEVTESWLISVSEIGIVTDNVVEEINKLMKINRLNLFRDFPVNDSFTALGDDHGLLIFVDSERNWYPTSQKAKRCPLKVKIENGGSFFDYEI